MIGTGVFTSLGYQLVDIQSIFPLLMLWVVGGIVALCGALTYSELGSALPRSGGEYHLLHRILHPSVGFAAGIVSATVGFTAPSVLAAMALGSYLKSVFPFFDQTIIASLVIVFFHVLHMRSIRWGTIFQSGSTAIKVGLLFTFIVFGFLTTNTQSISILPKSGDGIILLSSSFAVSLVWVSYAYTGWNSVIYIAGEIKDPKDNISKTMVIATSLVMFIYVLLNYIFLNTASVEDMSGQVDIGYISGIAIFGSAGAKIIGLGISILLLSTVSSYVYIGPRIMQIMGEDHKFISFLNVTNKNNIPINAFFLQLAISFFFIITSSFEQVLMYAGITLIIITTLTVISLFILRYKEPYLDRPYKVWGYPFTPLIYLIVNVWILFYSFQHSQFESSIGIGIIIISIAIHFIFDRKYTSV
ncbi:MAG: amino acid permease [bacterium TMED46]|nr:MAG: amino acid permease [bacterium TMED46]|tara:strand:+ start:12182 stop:13426 length:1245 start_codon:yes stop_codon:yes gene_type:complete